MSAARRAFLHLLIGAWLGITACTIVGAVMSFRSAGMTRNTPVEEIDEAARAQAVRFNLRMFFASAFVQVAIGGVVVALAAWPPRAGKGVVLALAAAAAVALVFAVVLVPSIAEVGRILMDRIELESQRRATMQHLHRLYAVLDLLKALCLVLAFTATTKQARDAEMAA